MTEQIIGTSENEYLFLEKWLKKHSNSSVMIVCGKSFDKLKIAAYFWKYADKHNVSVERFSDFLPNPDYSSVVSGVKKFNSTDCKAIVAVGGGSAMDVAKCIKLYHNMDSEKCFLNQNIIPNDKDFLAVPTTAGTGSEATKYAVVYYNGEKQSIYHDSCIPGSILFDPLVLNTLNDYHRKASMLDALSHSIESFWSVNSNDESISYSEKAIRMICENVNDYLANKSEGNKKMMEAAYLAGKAINITQTTAGHAMCYKLTSIYGIAHGYAAALCNSQLWIYMLENVQKCSDLRGREHLEKVFSKIAEAFGCSDAYEAVNKYNSIVKKLFEKIEWNTDDIDCLSDNVNPERLKNNPVTLDRDTIKGIYTKIMQF